LGSGQQHTMERMKSRVHVKSAENAAAVEILAPESLEDKFQVLENQDKVEMLLAEIKSRHAQLP
jgi:phage shock protein A